MRSESSGIAQKNNGQAGLINKMVYLCDAGSCKRYDDGHDVDGQLELKELGDTVVHVPSPHDGFNDAGKVVVGQNDV